MSAGVHLLVIEARYYGDLADHLLAGARAALETAGATHEVVTVPGVFEVPGALRIALDRSEGPPFAGYVALGTVIRGETDHYTYVCDACVQGVNRLVLDYALAFGFGVLTCETYEQALERAHPQQLDKGGEAVRAALAMIDLKRRFAPAPR